MVTKKMVTSYGLHALCFLYIGFNILAVSLGTKTIKEDSTYKELKTIVISIVKKESGRIFMKFTLSFDVTTLWTL